MNLEELQDEIQAWQIHNWGEPDSTSVWVAATKLMEEVGELANALTHGESPSVVKTEVADVIISTIAVALRAGCVGADNVNDAVTEKWTIVRERDPHRRHQPRSQESFYTVGQ